MSESKKVVLMALVANGLIAVAKFVAAGMTGSSAMLSEAYHSVSDTGNQVLLLIGIRQSEKDGGKKFPFGRGKEQFFWSFVVSVMLFGIAGAMSFREGLHKMEVGGHVGSPTVSLVVLGLAAVFESFALYKAVKEFRKEMDRYGGPVEAFRRSRDAPLITALTEDVVALLGIFFAGAGIWASMVTGDAYYDGVSSLAIGVMLMAFALVLAWENRKLLVGEGVSKEERDLMVEAIQGVEGVEGVFHVKTMIIGPKSVLVAAEVDFREGMSTEELEAGIDAVDRALEDAVPEVKSAYIEVC